EQYKFTDDTVVQLAARLSADSRPIRKLDSNSPLRTITYDQYRDIRVNPDGAIWRNDQVPLRVEVLPAGFLFQTPVIVSIVENGMAQDIGAMPSTFTLGPSVTKALSGLSLPLSGFRVRAHIN